MIILFPYEEENIPVVLIFGVGLIGNAILNKILSLFKYKIKEIDFIWNDKDKHFDTLEKIANFSLNADSIEIIWSAGKANFSMKKNEADYEFEIFRNISKFIGCNILR